MKATRFSHKSTLKVVVVLFLFLNVALGQQRLWTRIYNHGQDLPASVTMDPAGNVIATGSSFLDVGTWDIITFKYDPSGNLLWSQIYDTRDEDQAHGIATDDSGNVFVCGDRMGTGLYGSLVKYNSEGSQIWEKSIDLGPYIIGNFPWGVAVDEDNNILVGGYVWRGDNFDYFGMKLDQNGNILWQSLYDRDLEEQCFAIATDNQNNVILAGFTWNGPDNNYDFWTIKIDTWGNQLWSKTCHHNFLDVPWAIGVDSENNIVVAGYSANDTNTTNPSFASQYFTVKYNPAGDTLWTRIFDYRQNNDAFGIAINNSDEIFVTGICADNSAPPEWVTIKYSPNGDIIWTLSALDAPKNNRLSSQRQYYWLWANPKVATDDANNFYLFSHLMQGNFDFILHKYREVSGIEEENYSMSNKDFSLILSNPMSSRKLIGLTVNKSDKFKVTLYNSAGQFVQDIYSGKLLPGYYRFVIAEELNGIYFLLVESKASGVVRQKIIMVK